METVPQLPAPDCARGAFATKWAGLPDLDGRRDSNLRDVNCLYVGGYGVPSNSLHPKEQFM